MELLEADSYLSRTQKLIDELGFRPLLEGAGSLTFFAPRDIAFDLADSRLVARLYQQPYLLHAQSIINYHILEERVCGLELGVEKQFQAANGEVLESSESSGTLSLIPVQNGNAVMIVDSDELASNGVLHAIDRLILPKWVSQELFDLFQELSDYSVMNELVVAASMD